MSKADAETVAGIFRINGKDYLRAGPESDDLELARSGDQPRDIDWWERERRGVIPLARVSVVPRLTTTRQVAQRRTARNQRLVKLFTTRFRGNADTPSHAGKAGF